ncbi:MAG: SDR family oxidoreductase [Rhizobiaceae bacterium]|nr:SDR family oxidoreductase [Rhizobiaceae bacterium]
MRKILILGVSGMLGNAAYQLFAKSEGWGVVGWARNLDGLGFLPRTSDASLVGGLDISSRERLLARLEAEKPDVVLNCIGVIKQLAEAKDPITSIEINALLPHQLARICAAIGARLVHISTDCVFNGRKGMYREADPSDAEDLYGRTKYLGEVDYEHAISLRTSIIGHEIRTSVSLLDWFLSQPGPSVKGYAKAVFSGLTTVELSRVIRDVVLPRPQMHGLWHVASKPIDKMSLLRLIAEAYDKKVEIIPDFAVEIDRSLNAERFHQETGYAAPEWPQMIQDMSKSVRPSPH